MRFSGADCLQDATGNFKTGLRSKHMSNAKHYEWLFVNIFQRKVVKDIHCSVLKDQTFKTTCTLKTEYK